MANFSGPNRKAQPTRVEFTLKMPELSLEELDKLVAVAVMEWRRVHRKPEDASPWGGEMTLDAREHDHGGYELVLWFEEPPLTDSQRYPGVERVIETRIREVLAGIGRQEVDDLVAYEQALGEIRRIVGYQS